ncbi:MULTISPECIES: Arm DNA-binding domain-containing protein [unclassified Ruegeria]|uniref:Arm DNA-binding domain-containing protein n=1 Tax=unclassified Ruegeria TaxID=2625375 RepID=UPI00209E81BD|nr:MULTISPECIES: Arm DNA-binding domain-containing protein [unclassified Ruegeria]
MSALSGKLTKKLVENLCPGRHGDGSGQYLVVDPSGVRHWIVRVEVKEGGQAIADSLQTGEPSDDKK